MEKYLNWLAEVMKAQFDMTILPEEISYESYEMYHEEIDESIVPKEHLEQLPDPLLFETLLYIDEHSNEWIGGIVLEEGSNEWLYTVLIKNGEAILNRFEEETKGE